MTRTHKYNAKTTVFEGIKFRSKHEAGVYASLLALQRDGMIREIVRQPKFQFCKGVKYTADFKVTWMTKAKHGYP